MLGISLFSDWFDERDSAHAVLFHKRDIHATDWLAMTPNHMLSRGLRVSRKIGARVWFSKHQSRLATVARPEWADRVGLSSGRASLP
jgi:hypothetical protein